MLHSLFLGNSYGLFAEVLDQNLLPQSPIQISSIELIRLYSHPQLQQQTSWPDCLTPAIRSVNVLS